MNHDQKNADRFLGFADLYDHARPRVPKYPVNVICRYLGRNPQLVVDMGCGTGLSSEIWQEVSGEVIGIEPSDDMRRIAESKSTVKMHFKKGFSDRTGLADSCADVVVCSQAFHWMEPKATLKEVNRILKQGGVFATIDCDWPPVAKWEAEQAYMQLYDKVKLIEVQRPEIRETFVRYPKDQHLKNIKESGYFTYSRELLFSNSEPCTKQRFRSILFSQGSTQIILKKCPELIREDGAAFYQTMDRIFGDETFNIEFCYRMRIGIK